MHAGLRYGTIRSHLSNAWETTFDLIEDSNTLLIFPLNVGITTRRAMNGATGQTRVT